MEFGPQDRLRNRTESRHVFRNRFGRVYHPLAQYVLEEPAPLALSLSPEAARCYKGSDGRIQTLPEGGTPPYSLAWSTGSVQMAIVFPPRRMVSRYRYG